MKPLDVECYQCGAKPGVRCWSGTRRGRHLTRGYHDPRERLARGEEVQKSTERWLCDEIGAIRERVARESLARREGP